MSNIIKTIGCIFRSYFLCILCGELIITLTSFLHGGTYSNISYAMGVYFFLLVGIYAPLYVGLILVLYFSKIFKALFTKFWWTIMGGFVFLFVGYIVGWFNDIIIHDANKNLVYYYDKSLLGSGYCLRWWFDVYGLLLQQIILFFIVVLIVKFAVRKNDNLKAVINDDFKSHT